MNAFELLKSDHDKVGSILEKLEETTERAVKTRETLFAKLKEDLDLHTEIEETVFYPALRDKEKTQDITLKAYETHKVIKTLLNELAPLPVDTQEWTAKLKVLKETVEQHVDEEESEMFKSARQVLTKKEIDDLSEQMGAAKRAPEESAKLGTDRGSAVGLPGAGIGKSPGAQAMQGVSGSFCFSPCALMGGFIQSLCGQPQTSRG
jgi:hemerythrin-like domain-containing protein